MSVKQVVFHLFYYSLNKTSSQIIVFDNTLILPKFQIEAAFGYRGTVWVDEVVIFAYASNSLVF